MSAVPENIQLCGLGGGDLSYLCHFCPGPHQKTGNLRKMVFSGEGCGCGGGVIFWVTQLSLLWYNSGGLGWPSGGVSSQKG